MIRKGANKIAPEPDYQAPAVSFLELVLPHNVPTR